MAGEDPRMIPKRTGSGARRDLPRGVLVVGVVIAIALSVALLAIQPAMEPDTVNAEFVKAFIQLTVVAFGAALVAAGVSAIEGDRQRRDQLARDREVDHRLEVEFLMRWLGDATDAYNAVKAVRRSFEHVPGDPPELGAEHDTLIAEQLKALDKAQLTFERLMRVMRVRGLAYAMPGSASSRPEYQALERDMRQIEGYLGDILADARLHHHASQRLRAFLGDEGAVGGIRGGPLTPYESKEDRTDGQGPSAQLRDAERTVAHLIRFRSDDN